MDLLTQCDVLMVTVNHEQHQSLVSELAAVCGKPPQVHGSPFEIGWLEQSPGYRSPDYRLILLDYRCPAAEAEVERAVQVYSRLLPAANVALFNTVRRVEIEMFALLVGIHGVFFENDTVSDVLRGVTAILSGERWFRRRILSAEFHRRAQPSGAQPSDRLRMEMKDRFGEESPLSSREREVLRCMMHGASNKQVAHELCISEHTVRTHNYRIYRKLNVHNRVEALNWAETHLL